MVPYLVWLPKLLSRLHLAELPIRCMGYHTADDKDMPAAFNCFDCRVRADQHWELIMVHNLHPRMMERFRDLALFRCVTSGIFETTMILQSGLHAGVPSKSTKSTTPTIFLLFRSSLVCISVSQIAYIARLFAGCEALVAGQLFKRLDAEGKSERPK